MVDKKPKRKSPGRKLSKCKSPRCSSPGRNISKCKSPRCKSLNNKPSKLKSPKRKRTIKGGNPNADKPKTLKTLKTLSPQYRPTVAPWANNPVKVKAATAAAKKTPTILDNVAPKKTDSRVRQG